MRITAEIHWTKFPSELFTDGKYHRTHRWIFDGGTTLDVSASPDIVPEPLSDASYTDPEEAFIASVSSCHMLLFLSLASRRKMVVRQYADSPEGVLEMNSPGARWISSIVLKPHIVFEGNSPTTNELAAMHREAHGSCFLANSVKSKITIEPSSK